MRAHHRRNAATWGQLKKHGVGPETELVLEGHFVATSEESALAILEHLRADLGYQVEVAAPPKRRLFRRVAQWNVTSATPPVATNPDHLDAWTDRMVQAAVDHGVEFDGWGTMVARHR